MAEQPLVFCTYLISFGILRIRQRIEQIRDEPVLLSYLVEQQRNLVITARSTAVGHEMRIQISLQFLRETANDVEIFIQVFALVSGESGLVVNQRGGNPAASSPGIVPFQFQPDLGSACFLHLSPINPI